MAIIIHLVPFEIEKKKKEKIKGTGIDNTGLDSTWHQISKLK